MRTSLALNRFSPGSGASDAIYLPDLAYGLRRPLVFMDGGGITPDQGLGLTGAAHVVPPLVADGWPILHPSVPNMVGNDLSRTRIHDAIDYGISEGICADLDPAFIGISNGAVCSLIFSRDNAVAGLMLCQCPTNALDPYLTNDNNQRQIVADAWGVTFPTLPPARFSPWHDRLSYKGLGLKAQQWYASNDQLHGENQISMGAYLGWEQHLLGDDDHTAISINKIVVPDLIRFARSLL